MSIVSSATVEDELAQAKAEMRDLQRTVMALRAELESAALQRRVEVQQAAQTGAAEIAQLKTTVGALRAELERARGECEHQVQQEDRKSVV